MFLCITVDLNRKEKKKMLFANYGTFNYDNLSPYNLHRIHVCQYRSRTKVNDDCIKSAFCYWNKEGLKVYTEAIERDEQYAQNRINALLDNIDINPSVRLLRYFNSTRNIRAGEIYAQKLKEVCTELTINWAIPQVECRIFVKDNYIFVVANTMSAQLWWNIASEFVPNTDWKEAWRTGSGTEINKVINKANDDEIKIKTEQFISEADTIMSTLRESTGSSPLKEELQCTRSEIEQLYTQIESKTNRIREIEKELIYQKTLSNLNILAPLKTMIMKMYRNGTLVSAGISEDFLNFTLKTKIVYLNKEDFNTLKNTTRRNWYTTLSDWEKQLFVDLFNGVLKLEVIVPVRIGLARGTITVDRNTDAYINPHHLHYNCWGDYTRKITDAVINYKWDEALSYILIASAGINILDTPVAQRMSNDLAGTYKNTAMLITESGEKITPEQYRRNYIFAQEDE